MSAVPPGQVLARRAEDALVMSGSRLLHEQARGAILLAPALFRLDVAAGGDNLRVRLRPLGPWQVEQRGSGYGGTSFVSGDRFEQDLLISARHDFEFELRGDDGVVDVTVVLGTVREPERGLVRFSAQATVERRDA